MNNISSFDSITINRFINGTIVDSSLVFTSDVPTVLITQAISEAILNSNSLGIILFGVDSSSNYNVNIIDSRLWILLVFASTGLFLLLLLVFALVWLFLKNRNLKVYFEFFP